MPAATASNLFYGLRETGQYLPASGNAAAKDSARGAEMVTLYKTAAPAVVLIVVGGRRGFGSAGLNCNQ